MDVVLINCCARKRPGGDRSFQPSRFLGHALEPMTYQHLLRTRRELAEQLELNPGVDLGFEEHGEDLLFMPAFRRYDGVMYHAAQFEGLFPITRDLRIVIISALYGLLDPADLIRIYDLRMDHKLPSGERVYAYWSRQGLGFIMEKFIGSRGPGTIHDLLSKDYRNALAPWPPPGLEANMRRYRFPGRGMGALHDRGRILKLLLETPPA